MITTNPSFLGPDMQPLLKPTVVLCPSEDSYLAYDIDANQLHRLNPLTALIVELADGERSMEELVDEVIPCLRHADAPRCMEWVEHVTSHGLLVDAASSRIVAPTAQRLHDLATQLRSSNRPLAAFVCQQRAADLAPQEPRFWLQLSELARRIGRSIEACAADERYRKLTNDGTEQRRPASSTLVNSSSTRVLDRCIESLHGGLGATDQGVDTKTRASELLSSAFVECLAPRHKYSILDVGCGSGLFGQKIRPLAKRLVGIDLSSMSIGRAHERAVYDHLQVTELSHWLCGERDELFDVIAICDVLNYFSDLTAILREAARHLTPKGQLGFTVESGTELPFRLTGSGRIAHHPDHLALAIESAGFRVIKQTDEILRYESGTPVMGSVTILGDQDE